MSKFQAVLQQFQKALQRFDEILKVEYNDIVRDSAIQRFEFVFDLSWKPVGGYLEEHQGLSCSSPKGCFKEGFSQNIPTHDDFWLELSDLRNLTSHTYQEELAEKVYKVLPEAKKRFDTLLDLIKTASKI